MLLTNEEPAKESFMEKWFPKMKAYWKKEFQDLYQGKTNKEYELIADAVYHINGGRKGMVIPDLREGNEVLRAIVLQSAHEEVGHMGLGKTINKLKEKELWWKGIAKDAKDFVGTCDKCQRNKQSTTRPYGFLHPLDIPSQPFTHIAMDFVGPLPRSNGYNGILVMIDRFSSYTVLIPIDFTIDAPGVAKAFKDYWYVHYGLPISIVSDRDPRFTGNVWTSLMKMLKVLVRLSSAFHPQTDGQLERMNKVIAQILRALVSRRQNDWVEHMPAVQFSINNTVNESTGYSPAQIVYGRDPISVINHQIPTLENPFSTDFMQQLQDIHAEVYRNVQQAREKQSTHYNKRRRKAPKFQPGDKVLLNGKNISIKQATVKSKLSPLFYGPFTIIEAFHDTDNYTLELPHDWEIHPTYHISLLKKYNENDDIRFPN